MSDRMISLKNMLAEAFYYDIGKEKTEFDTSVASATENAKNKFETSMKEKVLNQKVKIRASKGQPGQPEKDYIIDKVSAVSVDWYYKQYVVVFKDEKSKEYFLKPGFKVEVLSAAAQTGQQPTQQTPAEPAKPAKPAMQAPPPAAKAPKPATGAPVPPAGGTAPAAPTKPTAKPMEEAQQEYKKEWAAEIMGEVLYSFLSPTKQEEGTRIGPARLVFPYIKSSKWEGGPATDADTPQGAVWELEIPVEDMRPDLDVKELQLAITDGLRSAQGPGQEYTRGFAEIDKIGRFYRIKVEYTTGLDV